MKQQPPCRRHDRFVCVLGNAMAENLDARLFALRISSLPGHGLALSVLASLPGLRSSTFYSVRHVRARVRVHLRRVTADNNNASEDETAARLRCQERRKEPSAHEDSRTHNEAPPEFHEKGSGWLGVRLCLFCACVGNVQRHWTVPSQCSLSKMARSVTVYYEEA